MSLGRICYMILGLFIFATIIGMFVAGILTLVENQESIHEGIKVIFQQRI